jgi:ArsR family transcriptional regulator
MSSESSLDRALHAIADPTRRRILLVLKQGMDSKTPAPRHIHASCLCGGDIEERIRLSQPTVSHHMSILTKAGLVEATKHGQWRWYRRNEKAIRQVVKMLRGKL